MSALLELVELDPTIDHGDGSPPSSDTELVEVLERIALELGHVRLGLIVVALVAGALLLRLMA